MSSPIPLYTDDTKKDIARVLKLTRPWLVGGIDGDKSVGLSTVVRASEKKYLNFSTFTNKRNVGIHAAGCGVFLDEDTIGFTKRSLLSALSTKQHDKG